MRSVILFGAIFLAACGSVTLVDAPDSGPSNSEVSQTVDSGASQAVHDGSEIALGDRDASRDAEGASVSPPLSRDGEEVETSPDTGGGSETGIAPPDAGFDSQPVPQSCTEGTCYPKTDPQHTSCPCHY